MLSIRPGAELPGSTVDVGLGFKNKIVERVNSMVEQMIGNSQQVPQGARTGDSSEDDARNSACVK